MLSERACRTAIEAVVESIAAGAVPPHDVLTDELRALELDGPVEDAIALGDLLVMACLLLVAERLAWQELRKKVADV